MLPDIESLETSLDWWEYWFGYGGAVLVLIGVVGEYVAEFTRVSKTERWHRKIARGSTLLLIVGLTVELIGIVKTSEYTGKIVAVLNKQAAGALETAGKANERAGKFEKEAARLNKVAEDERLARLKLEEKLTWRNLTTQQQERIAEKIKTFSGIPFDLAVTPDPEAINFLGVVDKLLKSCGWAWRSSNAGSTITSAEARIVYFSGVVIQISPMRISDFEAAAKTLASALAKEGIDAKHEVAQLINSNPNVIHVMIGKKR